MLLPPVRQLGIVVPADLDTSDLTDKDPRSTIPAYIALTRDDARFPGYPVATLTIEPSATAPGMTDIVIRSFEQP
jgi:hypothetical protein